MKSRRRAQVLANIVDCGNSVEKFRRLRLGNSKFHSGVWCRPGGSEVRSSSYIGLSFGNRLRESTCAHAAHIELLYSHSCDMCS